MHSVHCKYIAMHWSVGQERHGRTQFSEDTEAAVVNTSLKAPAVSSVVKCRAMQKFVVRCHHVIQCSSVCWWAFLCSAAITLGITRVGGSAASSDTNGRYSPHLQPTLATAATFFLLFTEISAQNCRDLLLLARECLSL